MVGDADRFGNRSPVLRQIEAERRWIDAQLGTGVSGDDELDWERNRLIEKRLPIQDQSFLEREGEVVLPGGCQCAAQQAAGAEGQSGRQSGGCKAVRKRNAGNPLDHAAQLFELEFLTKVVGK